MSAEKPSDPAFDSTLRQRTGQATEPVSEPPAAEPRGFLDSRTGYRQLLRHLLDEPVRGGASFAYVFGSLLLFVLCNQALTGVLLMAFYAPSATDAWASVAYIQDQVQLGWFIRGMHSAGASVMMLGMCAHLLQVLIYGAYKKPRELNWLSGLFLVTLVFGFALTGYLLPWDQKGYWATQVATTLIGSIPLVGSLLQQLLQGGPTYGNLTLTHFYALHVFVLPVVVLVLVAIHLWVFRRHGVTPRWNQSPKELERTAEPFWPGQATRDLLAIAALLTFLAVWVIRTHGVDLAAPADPASRYDARPEWYFLPLYQLLKYFPGPLELLAALGIPSLIGLLLTALPFIDRGESTQPRRRLLPILLALSVPLGLLVLGVVARSQDLQNPVHIKHLYEAHDQAQLARRLALQGVPVAGGVAVYQNDPLEQGRLLIAEHCTTCHTVGKSGPAEADQKGPDLTSWGSRSWLRGFLQNPDSPHYYGKTKLATTMKAVQLAAEPMTDRVEYLHSLGNDTGPRSGTDAARIPRGEVLFTDLNCDICHERDGKTPGQGPNLGGYGQATWIRGLLQDPASPLYFGEKNDMPLFGKKLSKTELERLTLYLREQRLNP